MLAVMLAVAAVVWRQPPTAPAPQPTKPDEPVRQASPSIPPSVRLGMRADAVRRRVPQTPVVVIVPDPSSYVAAIGTWSMPESGPMVRFPVLIDDGTWQSQEDVARFVRAFRPEAVVRWGAPKDAALPADAPARQAAIEKAAAAAWGADSAAAVRERWKKLQFTPAGIVAATADDPAWTAALALAAGHGEPIVWVHTSQDISGALTMEAADELTAALQGACTALGYTWEVLGDDIDAVSLCLNCPVQTQRFDLSPKDARRYFATTDVIGRYVRAEREERWAWAGQVFGTEARAAYWAMCALFLEPRRAWLFDGYEDKPPWSAWDAMAAGQELARVGLATAVSDKGRQGADDWRLFTAGRARVERAPGGEPGAPRAQERAGVDAGLIAVNTMGNADFFDLRPGQCRAGDVPVLEVPAMVHFVHSWSCTRPADRTTVGGRWLERGAYGYVGATFEPYLQAFVPTPLLARRLTAAVPWGAAARLDNGPPWKIAVLGDPLMTLGPAAPRLEAEQDGTPGGISQRWRLSLAGAADVQEELGAAVKAKRFDQALRDLSLLGRGGDAARLARAIINDEPAALTPDVALNAVMSVYLAGAPELETFKRVYAALGPEAERHPELKDLAWQALWPVIGTLREDEIGLLRTSVRADQVVRDAMELTRAVERVKGRGAARQILAEIRATVTDAEARKALDAEMAR